MSYIFNNNPAVKYSDSPNLDAFGRLRVSEITSILEISQVYDKRPYVIDEVIGGTATSTHSKIFSHVQMSGTGANSYVIRQSFLYAPYQPGKSQIFEGSFSNFQIENNVIKRVGQFSSGTGSTYTESLDGYFLESNGVTNSISFQVWRSGTLTLSAHTSVWNITEFDVSTINWSLSQLMMVDYQWLGVGRMRFYMVFGGIPYLLYERTGTNNLSNVYMTSPNKPIRYELRTLSGTGSFNMICAQASIEGALNQLWLPCSISHQQTTTLSVENTKYAWLGIKMNKGYEEISPILKQISILNTSNDDYLVTVEIDPVITGSYSFSASTQPEILRSFGDGTQTVTTNGNILASFIGAAGTSSLTSYELLDSQLNPGKKINGEPQQLWICITPLGANATFRGTVNVYYRK